VSFCKSRINPVGDKVSIHISSDKEFWCF